MKLTTLTVDCGGTGIKASVLDKTGKVLIDFPYLKTPYPLSPAKLIKIIEDFVTADSRIKRVTVGLPGMIRDGKIVFIPHYINKNGPRGAVDQQLKKELGLVYTEGEGRSINERLLLPSLTIKGLSSGNVGKKARNVIPNSATAAIGVRLVKGNDPEDMLDKIEAHIKSQGFHIVYETPDLNTRRNYSKIVRVDRRGSGYIASRTSMEDPNAKSIINAVKEYIGDDLILMPALGGSLPLYLFTDYLKKPAIIIPIANHDNNQHAPNENLRIANLWYGIDLMGVIMTMPN